MIEEASTEASVAEAVEIEAEAEEGPEEEERRKKRNGFPAPSWVGLFSKYEPLLKSHTNSVIICGYSGSARLPAPSSDMIAIPTLHCSLL